MQRVGSCKLGLCNIRSNLKNEWVFHIAGEITQKVRTHFVCFMASSNGITLLLRKTWFGDVCVAIAFLKKQLCQSTKYRNSHSHELKVRLSLHLVKLDLDKLVIAAGINFAFSSSKTYLQTFSSSNWRLRQNSRIIKLCLSPPSDPNSSIPELARRLARLAPTAFK